MVATTLAVSSPAIVAATDDNVPMFRVDAAHTGALPGEAPAGPVAVHWKSRIGSHAFSPPAIVGGVLFISLGDGNVVALDAATGFTLWRADRLASGSTPAVAGGLVFVAEVDGAYAPSGALVALDATSGAVRWRFETYDAIHFSPTVAEGVAVTLDDGGRLYAVDAASGAKRWQVATGIEGGDGVSIAAGMAFVAGATHLDGRFTGVVAAFDLSSGTERWRMPIGRGVLTSPAVADGRLYLPAASRDRDDVVTGSLYALDAATGRVVWRAMVEETAFTAPAVAGGLVYVVDLFGRIFALDAETGGERWRAEAGSSESSASPIVAGTTLLFQSAGTIHALESTTGSERWTFTIGRGGDGVDSSPVVAGGLVYVSGGDGYIYALGDA